eukprot:3342033-Pyramimonas_sp.AAC.1
MLERESGDKRGMRPRLCYDVVKEALASSKFTSLDKARIRAFATEAFFTGYRAVVLGYLVSSVCPFCGCEDTIFHRLWECQHGPVAEARASLVDQDMIDAAVAAKASDEHDDLLVFTSGAFRHPADVYPRALTEVDDGPFLVWHDDTLEPPDGGERGTSMWGSLFVDGSCSRHVVRELSRAASSVCMVGPDGQLLAEFRAPVWSPLPQTPQGAEFSALTWATVLARQPPESTVYSDCSSVVKTANRSKAEQLSAKLMYSGAFIQCYAQQPSICPCVKVAAHRDIDEAGIGPDERWCRQGNHHADVGAKAAVSLHPRDQLQLDAVDQSVRRARATLKLAAGLLH